MKEEIKLLTVEEVSRYFGLSIRTIQRLSKQGKIKGVKLGRQWKFFKEDIERYLSFGIDLSKQPARKPDTFTERRAFPRINTNLRCEYSVNLPPFKDINGKGIIKNLSTGGVLLIIEDTRPEAGDPINLNFMDIKTEGRILRKDKNRFGIKFRNLGDISRDKIIQYIG